MAGSMSRSLHLCAALIALCGCQASRDSFNPVKNPEPPQVGALGLPVNDAGALTLIENSKVALQIDPTKKTPVHTMRGCRFWLRACRQQNHEDLDLCMDHAPACKSARPWEVDEQCCPSACAKRYREHRAAGKADGLALMDTFEEIECFPGLAAYRRGEAP